jgi:Zn-finger protein
VEHSYKYFKNIDCKYFPCHAIDREADFNCLFCYCPMNQYENCLGTPHYITKENGTVIKDCSKCTYPHLPEHYDDIIAFLSQKLR